MTINSLDSEKVYRFFKGDHSSEDYEYLKKVFCDNASENELKYHLKKHWYELLKENIKPDKNLDHILYRIHYELNTEKPEFRKDRFFKKFVKWSVRIAAILFIPLLAWTGILFNKDSNKSKNSWIEIKAPAFSRVQFSLPDGSTGWLNSSSSLRYKGDFINNRSLTLSGEAFFDVREITKIPFVVNTNQINVTVSGTRFNIASYENENSVEVVLEEGQLVLNSNESNKSYTMSANDLVVYDKTIKEFSTKVVQSQKYLSWTEGKLVFRNDPLDVIARRLGRWYNVDVEINGDHLENVRLRATFVDENLEEVLYFLKCSLPIDYKTMAGGLMVDDETYTKKKIIFTMKKI